MTFARLAVASLFVACLALAGCQPRTQPEIVVVPPPPPAPVTEETRQEVAKKYPDALIGRVTDVLPSDRLAVVSSVPVADFQRGDAIVFWGSDNIVVGRGSVVDIVKDTLHIQYEDPSGHRGPMVGDLAIHFRK